VVVEANTGFLSPRFRNQNPPNMIARQFSFPHAVAMLVAREPAGPGWLSGPRPSDPDIAALRAKVTVEAHPKASACVQSFVRDQVREMPSGVRVKARGTVFHEEREFALGDPWDAKTRWGFADVARKFRDVTGLPEGVAEAAIKAVSTLERRGDLAPVTAALRVAMKPV
jgi:2-methylcitrate dehydratase PrpD